MRLKLTLSHKERQLIPFNYRYQLSAWIYAMLHSQAPSLAFDLHQSNLHKLITFSNITPVIFDVDRVRKCLVLTESPSTLEISFHSKVLFSAFVNACFQHKHIALDFSESLRVHFEFVGVEVLSEIAFSESMIYQAISPITIARKEQGKKHKQYMNPMDFDYANFFKTNLLNKYELVTNEIAGTPDFDFELLNMPKAKLVAIKRIKVKGYLYDFKLDAPIELQRIGYYGGFGQSNLSGGFGYCEILNKIPTDANNH